ncbi:hypothetical protein [Micromonospora sp. WMMD1082]|uniref:hypothetical protein n=1 Tax=Micromonospora sp. WMMD1082 TaxID=3016104 RepID=UPI002416230C|nr:hypothetical protein [Micromonospora sp. WMMD1082]MDG4792779.1 hypothetical protein [Micromonospora sp. WMMD1082]
MPHIIENPDGTKTFAITSTEVREIGDRLVEQIPEIKRVFELADGAWARTTSEFLKSTFLSR